MGKSQIMRQTADLGGRRLFEFGREESEISFLTSTEKGLRGGLAINQRSPSWPSPGLASHSPQGRNFRMNGKPNIAR